MKKRRRGVIHYFTKNPALSLPKLYIFYALIIRSEVTASEFVFQIACPSNIIRLFLPFRRPLSILPIYRLFSLRFGVNAVRCLHGHFVWLNKPLVFAICFLPCRNAMGLSNSVALLLEEGLFAVSS